MILPASFKLTLVFSLSPFYSVRLKSRVLLGPGQAKLLVLQVRQDQLCQGFNEDNSSLLAIHNGERIWIV